MGHDPPLTNGAETLGFKVIVSCRDYKLTLDKCTVQVCVAWRDIFFSFCSFKCDLVRCEDACH